jgi:hypothetical protein
MKKNWMTFRESILDAMADDGESNIQIESYLTNYYKVPFTRTEVVEQLLQLLHDGTIEIEYPDNSKIEELKNAEGEQIEDYWFMLTKKGRIEHQSIEFEPDDEDEN